MRVLASAEDERLATSPDVPTLKELGYDISSCSFFIVSAPKGLPADVKAKLSSALEKSIKSEDMQTLIKNLKYPPYYNGPDAVDRIIKVETESLARAVARINE